MHGSEANLSVRAVTLTLAVATGTSVILWTPAVSNTAVRRSVPDSPPAIRTLGSRPVAKVIVVSGLAWGLHDGGSRRLAAGSVVGAGEVVLTGADSFVLAATANGELFYIYARSRARFREDRWGWFSRVDQWLSGIRARIQGFGGMPPNNRVTCPTAVMGIRAGAGVGESTSSPEVSGTKPPKLPAPTRPASSPIPETVDAGPWP